MSMSRRSFLGSSAAAIVTARAASGNSVLGANDRIGVCVVGFRGQGRSHIRDIQKESDVEIVALCDVDSEVLEMGLKSVKEATGKTPKAFSDVREVMADDSIHAVTSPRWFSRRDPWVNMLRATVGGFAAAIGGARLARRHPTGPWGREHRRDGHRDMG